jgi:hypothetical protein
MRLVPLLLLSLALLAGQTHAFLSPSPTFRSTLLSLETWPHSCSAPLLHAPEERSSWPRGILPAPIHNGCQVSMRSSSISLRKRPRIRMSNTQEGGTGGAEPVTSNARVAEGGSALATRKMRQETLGAVSIAKSAIVSVSLPRMI